jgi:hypothetical protein
MLPSTPPLLVLVLHIMQLRTDILILPIDPL